MRTFLETIYLLKTIIKNSWASQTAYFGNTIVELGSTSFYMLTLLLFVKIIYSNIKQFAGYSQNEIYLLILISQFFVYLDYTCSANNIVSMEESVRTGDLDLMLTKPVSSLFYVTFRRIGIFSSFVVGLPNILAVSLLIDWSSINTDIIKILTGIAIFICGSISWHCFRFLFALPVFFVGQSKQLFLVSGSLGETENVPFEGFTDKTRIVFMMFVPALLTSQIPASVILGKSDSFQMLVVCLAIAGIFLMLKRLGWIISLRNYSSASS